MIKGSQIQDLHLGSTEMLIYLPVRGLRSAHYSEFGGSNPPVSIGEHGYRDLAQWKRVALITQRSQDRNLESRTGSTVTYSQHTAIHLKH